MLCAASACTAQSRIPQQMPEAVSIDYHQGGAMSRSYRKYSIKNGLLEFEQLEAGSKRTWSSPVSRREIAEVYNAFLRHRFDTIKNDERKAIVHDAGSESIALSAGPARFFRVTSGHNSPLSGDNLKRYLAVRKVLEGLIARHENKSVSAERDQDEITSETADESIQGSWRLEGANGRNAWHLEWEFTDGSFTQKGYPPLFQKGKYRIVAVNSRVITLELYEQSGNFGTKDRMIEIDVNDLEELTISGTPRFLRASS